jgi:hypothetical protein
VVFDETVFPFADLHPNAGKRLRDDILLLPSCHSSSTGVTHNDDHLHAIVPITTTPNHAPQENEAAGENHVHSSIPCT